MSTPSNGQIKAWIILSEAFGDISVRDLKPSTILNSHFQGVADVQLAMLEAFKADNRISSSLGFYGVDSLVSAGVATVTALYREHRDSVLAAGTLPSQNEKYRAWLDKPSFTRGLKLREKYTLAQTDVQGQSEIFPSGIDWTAAKTKIDNDILYGSSALGAQILNTMSPVKLIQ
ncbi:hypothetical protein LMG28688_00181 [Paraburkholderia caffeinitolerans]|uniref:Uncharacterized protein n=1 Tax=Paraburkholderia caffeinitolerans TaxID=1723730 RepID=A0A6J5FEX1_9BURK|nr:MULTISPECIES: hypothetical protein [Paraburkholderia]CAB3776178.1 hypothetical protein LMG28688_00181 [Paraburkholderia caffeinitolerans]